ncbi:hypothetical protein BDV28DRAFT_127751 [Aspergillus coremiiformis]|uniref:Integral membrane protein n=1 Tax=Aspergillus coremiiformis TaxID=138285 RepID=A0A5N6ZER7_9EURO|nr:hypothetical protein BDV28DRAFT_127751 [Aspergillus coremiiformis]
MDRIEPVDNSNGPSAEVPLSTQPTSSQSRQRASTVTSFRPRRPTIRLQRLSSLEHSIPQVQPGVSRNIQIASSINVASPSLAKGTEEEVWQGNRRRSSSEPRPGRWSTPNPSTLPRLAPDQMRPLMEEPRNSSPVNVAPPNPPRPRPQRRGSLGLLRWTSEAAMNRFTRHRVAADGAAPPSEPESMDNEYHPHIVDVLDVIDPEVSALSTLTNVQNSLFVPNLGPFINRNQTYTLSPLMGSSESTGEETTETEEGDEILEKSPEGRPSLERPLTGLSALLGKQDPQFAVLPEGSNLEGWTARDIEELNDHVRHMLHSRRSKFKRSMKGFGKYVSKPLGFLITLYATLITLFGLAWVLFLIGWINVGGRQLYIINVIDNVLVALFAIMGDGLAPFRAIDTYHMCFIAHYTFLTWKIRRKRQLPDLKDKNDLPTRCEVDADVEFGDTPKEEEHEFIVLNRQQQEKLVHHQTKMSNSHTFYKPHETLTHHAFPLRMLVAIVVLLDCHSLLQISLGACTWGISYHHRPFALTTVILCCSITCNISGGVLIMLGDRRTRKKDVVERLFREQLTREAMKKINKKKQKRQERRQRIEEQDEPRLSTSSRLRPDQGT